MSEEREWTAKQLAFIEWLANPYREGTQAELAETLGVAAETLSRWKDQDGFDDAVYSRAMNFIHSDLPDVLRGVSRKAKLGDVAAAKLVLELAGKYSPKLGVSGSGTMTLADLMLKAEEDAKGVTVKLDLI